MYPIDTYRITPNVFGRQRWQAEVEGAQLSRFARRAYSAEAAHAKISADEENAFQGRFTFMQGFWLPATMPLRRIHDKLCQQVEAAKRRRYSRKYHAQNR